MTRSVICGASALPPCEWADFRAAMNIRTGIICQIKHRYTRTGIVYELPFHTCVIRGVHWFQDCGVLRVSTATGDKALDAECVTVASGLCPRS